MKKAVLVFLVMLLGALVFVLYRAKNSENTLKLGFGGKPQEKKRLVIKFSKETPQEMKRAFFKNLGMRPIAFGVFGYDVAELKDGEQADKMDFRQKFSQFQTMRPTASITHAKVEEYQVEKREKRIRPLAGCAGRKVRYVVKNNLIVPWYDDHIKVSDAHAYLAKKKAVLHPQGVVIADDGPFFFHPDIAPALKKDEDGQPIFWSTDRRKVNFGDHGSHVSCLAAGYRDGTGMDGVAARGSYILPIVLNYYDENYFFSSDVAIGLKYFMDLEAEGKISFRVINMSFGAYQDLKILRATIRGLPQKIFVAAAGNDHEDMDRERMYPASWRFPNVVAVAATDENDRLAYFSNYGKTTVDIAAPGEDIVSCMKDGKYATKSGTSMAAPITTGAFALLFSMKPSMTVKDAKAMLFFGATSRADFVEKIVSGRRLNVFGAVQLLWNLTEIDYKMRGVR